MSKRISLREFQEGLARRFAQAQASDRRSLLAVAAGDSRWLIPLAEAGELLPVPPLGSVPLVRPWFLGLANVRGTLFGVSDFAQFLGHAPTRIGPASRLVLIGARRNAHCALLVEAALGLRSPEDFEVISAQPQIGRPWDAQHWRDHAGQSWHFLDVPALLADPNFLDVGR